MKLERHKKLETAVFFSFNMVIGPNLDRKNWNQKSSAFSSLTCRRQWTDKSRRKIVFVKSLWYLENDIHWFHFSTFTPV